MVQKLGLALSLPTIKTVASSAFENLYSLDFDGVDDYVDFGSGAAFTPNSSGANRGFSISLWAKTTAGRIKMVSKQNGGDAEYYVKIGASGDLEVLFFGNNSGAIIQRLIVDTSYGGFIAVNDGNWHHIAATFNLGSTASSIIIYVDGVEFSDSNGGANYTSTGTWSPVINTSAYFALGASSRSFSGNIDELSIWDGSLNQSGINEIYNSGTPTDLSGKTYLLGWWRNGDPTGTGAYPTIVDQSTNSNDGTMTNMASGDIVTDVP